MIRTFLNSKIHKATVTDAKIDYEGSCQIDIELLNAAGILPNEKIDIYNITNGERLSTYAIVGPPASGSICVNGAACHKAKKGDKIIICTYAELESSEISNHSPKIIHVDDENRIIPKKVNQKLNIQNG
ncbi:MAG: aspartate 1-decarboxylase [Gammaproteobacteria bacterium]|nr:aspartate 1-decarboxylase [Gammaproteobacteria bacterium]|tara:strand:+ start:1773 stop:2159 length:387 start_codon:yes stop_codon:yes gene_type:complete